MILNYETGDIITLKKGHPCGENKWEILRTGIDIKLKCLGCDREIWIPRIDFEKRIRKILVDEKWISIIHHKGSKKMNDYKCTVCSYTYRPERGDPTQDIEKGREFNDLPETWKCPTCNQSKMAFEEAK